MSPPPLTPNHALFLDIDGTLIDLAPTPDAVIVPPGLGATLLSLREKLGGALAILSGRKLEDIDRLLPEFSSGADSRPSLNRSRDSSVSDQTRCLPAGAEHGMILRDSSGRITSTAKRPEAYAKWLQTLSEAAKSMPGVLIEEKQFSLVAHYRRAPQFEAPLRALVQNLLAASPGATLLLAHCAFELKPKSGNKADALAHFMALAPFAGRLPVFIGDDTTDEPAIARANELGGMGLHVARNFGGKTRAVRDWLNL